MSMDVLTIDRRDSPGRSGGCEGGGSGGAGDGGGEGSGGGGGREGGGSGHCGISWQAGSPIIETLQPDTPPSAYSMLLLQAHKRNQEPSVYA